MMDGWIHDVCEVIGNLNRYWIFNYSKGLLLIFSRYDNSTVDIFFKVFFISKIHIYILNSTQDLHQNNKCGWEESEE